MTKEEFKFLFLYAATFFGIVKEICLSLFQMLCIVNKISWEHQNQQFVCDSQSQTHWFIVLIKIFINRLHNILFNFEKNNKQRKNKLIS